MQRYRSSRYFRDVWQAQRWCLHTDQSPLWLEWMSCAHTDIPCSEIPHRNRQKVFFFDWNFSLSSCPDVRVSCSTFLAFLSQHLLKDQIENRKKVTTLNVFFNLPTVFLNCYNKEQNIRNLTINDYKSLKLIHSQQSSSRVLLAFYFPYFLSMLCCWFKSNDILVRLIKFLPHGCYFSITLHHQQHISTLYMGFLFPFARLLMRS